MIMMMMIRTLFGRQGLIESQNYLGCTEKVI